MTSGQVSPPNVGVIYQLLGIVALVGLLVLDVVATTHGQLNLVIVSLNIILLLVILALIRPAFFNDAVKTLASKLPGA